MNSDHREIDVIENAYTGAQNAILIVTLLKLPESVKPRWSV